VKTRFILLSAIITTVAWSSSCAPPNYPEQLAREYAELRKLLMWYANEGNLPPATLAQTMAEWKKMPQGTPFSIEDDSSHFKWLRKGTDPWGSPFVFHVNIEKRIVTIRSLGRNRTDENGAGDDIEHKYDLSTQGVGRIQ
jgi:hypothetical protein